jgi:hypothetical protein
MLLSEKIKKEIDGINKNRSLSPVEILGLFHSFYCDLLPKIEQLEQQQGELCLMLYLMVIELTYTTDTISIRKESRRENAKQLLEKILNKSWAQIIKDKEK